MLKNANPAFLVLTALGLAAGLQAHAQSAPITPAAPKLVTRPQPPALMFTSFAAANDSLLRRVARARSQTDALVSSFEAKNGSFGGLHRKIRSYASLPDAKRNEIVSFSIKQQIIKHRYGIELEKVTYRDARDRKVLTERYEGHQLTRLELFEYSDPFGAPVANWLFVRGDYLRYTFKPFALTNKNGPRKSYFFRPRPAGE